MPSTGNATDQEANDPPFGFKKEGDEHEDDQQEQVLARKVWKESKKLWHIAGPAILSRVASHSMIVISQAFAGHLGDLELAAISMVCNVIIGIDLGILVYMYFIIYILS